MGWIKNFFTLKKYKINRHISHLNYAYSCLKEGSNEKYIGYEDRLYKLDAIKWLLDYYISITNNETPDKSPERKLEDILRMSSKEVGAQEHVFSYVLFYWVKNKRIDCY